MKNKKLKALPKELVKPTEIDLNTSGDSVEFLCREFGSGTTCRINGAIDEESDILF
ncbi:hypothetical protein [Flagellimonas meridianipacifica]|uniref:Uncharacterized protein n=1 Tax=Flagellimonas meridianipacifica TaxID=1080225 RepID=A0A2T0MFN8_9FLAO|nr:hypothetical protein [Allomuricauda pacifica]PRX56383.1 hypothetical protein CLV81_0380 [Allomuricauda pacifica]